MYERLLYPVDGSDLAEVALPHVRSFALGADAEVFVLEAVEIVTEVDAMTVPERHAEAEQYVQHLADQLRADGVRVSAVRAIDGHAGRTIVEVAKSERLDAIVMASRGRGGVRRFVLGSVADYVVRHAPCPVLLVHPPHDAGS